MRINEGYRMPNDGNHKNFKISKFLKLQIIVWRIILGYFFGENFLYSQK